jgi:molybdate transport system substrate-binding protein
LGVWSWNGRVASLGDLLKAEIRGIAIPNPAHAPYGKAAVEMLKGAGLYERLKAKLIYGENVRQAYEFASTGNADAVITSWTLLTGAKGALKLEAGTHPPIRQAGGVVAGSANAGAARKFLDFLLSPAGQAVLRKGGLDQP